jgi:tyrosinase
MGSVPTAAQDPIFYVHHSNVDRQWNLWLAQGGGRSDPVLDSAWTGRAFVFFDENGAPLKMTACQILRAAQQLNYAYEGEPPQVNQYCRRRPPYPWWLFERELLIQLPIPPIELKAEPVGFAIELQEIQAKLAPLLESKTDTLLLELDGVEAEKQPGVVWAVFVGLPAGTAPDASSPHYVGSLSLFGEGVRSERHHKYRPARFIYPLNRAVQASLKANARRLEVSFVPLGLVVDGKPARPEVLSPVTIGKASLFIERGKEGK